MANRKGWKYKFTPEAIAFLRRNSHLADRKVAAILGCCRETVCNKRRQLGIAATVRVYDRPAPKPPKPKVPEFLERGSITLEQLDRSTERLERMMRISARIETLKRWRERAA